MILSDEQVNTLASPLVEILEKFYEDEKNVKEFKKWLENAGDVMQREGENGIRHKTPKDKDI